MPKFTASVWIEGQGRIKFESDSLEHAREDAEHMDIEDVDWSLYNIKVENVKEVTPTGE